jgi:hypothetical protein
VFIEKRRTVVNVTMRHPDDELLFFFSETLFIVLVAKVLFSR